jgi:hypothetical protein
MSGAYGAVGGRLCDECSGPHSPWLNPLVPCARCDALLCRRCFGRGCALALELPAPVGALVLSLPLALVSPCGGAGAGGARVCGPCVPAARREAAFVSRALPGLRAGDVFARQTEPGSLSLLGALAARAGGGGPAEEAVMVTLSAEASSGGAPAVAWATLALSRNAPRAAGAVPLSAVSQVVVQQPGEVGGAEGSGALRLLDGGGAALLVLASRDGRLLRRWASGLNEACVLARAPGCRAFAAAAAAPPRAPFSAAGAGAGADAGGDARRAELVAARAAEVVAREARLDARQREREAFRASLGEVGMAHTAAAMVRLADDRAAGAGAAAGDAPAPAPAAPAPAPAAPPSALAALSSLASRLRAMAGNPSLLAPPPGSAAAPPPPPPPARDLRGASGAVLRRVGAGSPHAGLRGGPPPPPPPPPPLAGAAASAPPSASASAVASSSSLFAARLGELSAQRSGAAGAPAAGAGASSGAAGGVAGARNALASLGRSLRTGMTSLARDVIG